MAPVIVIAAAGKGTRMKELSLAKPKHLIEVAAKPFLYYLLKHIYESGIHRVIIVIGHLSAEFDKFISQYDAEFPGLEIVNQYAMVGQDRYGSLMPLLAVRHLVATAPFLMVNGDHLYSVSDLEFFKKADQAYNYVAATTVTEPSKFGTLVIDSENFLVRIEEKVLRPATNLINAGLYSLQPEIFSAADQVKLSPRGEYEITDAITILAQQKKVKIVQLKDYWLDFGRPDDIKVAEDIIANNY